jgi:Tol biopolymer transport system component
MKSLRNILILAVALIIVVNLPARAQTPEQLYQRALVKEEGEGAMEEAISLYDQVADNSNADQALRAKALLHIGMCYERMGTQEAIEAYQRLVTNFPTQKNEVAIARERLNSLILTVGLSQKDEKKPMSIRKVLPDTDIEPLGSPSPDGRYISFIDWNSGGNVCILDLETNERRCLTDFQDPNEEAYYSCWSPDGKQIAYFWWVYDKDQYNLSIVDVEKAESRVLFKSDKYGWIELGNWSLDGKYIFAIISLREEPKSEILRVSTADGSIKLLKKFEISFTGGKPYISPDDRMLAYDLPNKDDSGNSDIYLLDLENGQEGALIRHPSHDYILGWTPDGNHILFATDRSGTVDAMIIAVEDGKQSGQPKTVLQNIGPIVPMGFTKDGSFYYGQWPGASNVYSAEINFDEGKLMKKPTLFIQRFEGRNYSPDYSSDGKFLVYISERGVLNKGNSGRVLCIRNLDTDEEIVVNPDPQMSGSMSDLQWSPDNHSILLTGANQEGYSRIYSYDIQLSKFLPLVTESNDDSSHEYAYPLWSKDGASVYYLNMSRYSTSSRIMVRNIATGVDKELYNYTSDDFMDRLFNISLSPDGKWLAAINRGENRVVRLISTNDGTTRDLYKFKSPGGFPFSQIWSSEGKYIIFPYKSEESGWNLMRVAFDDGEKQIIEMNIKGIGSPSLHPDGRHLSFSSAGYSFPENNIWEMKNFLQQEKDPEGMLAEEPEGIEIKQIWKAPYLGDIGTVSSDGQFRSCVDWGWGDLAIHNLITGENRRLTHESKAGHFILNTAISKNGKQIAYCWWGPDHTYDLCLVDVENPKPQLLYRQEGEEVYPMTWLSDKELIMTRYIRETNTADIVSFNIPDKTLHVLKPFERSNWPQLSCSPDEKYIAYDFGNKTHSGNSDINILPIDGSEEISLVNHPANDRALGWVPGRKEFLFISDRSGLVKCDPWDLLRTETVTLVFPGAILIPT